MNTEKIIEKQNLTIPFTAYKVFDPDWKCRNKQYKVGEEYHEDKIKICEYGIHACLKVLDCFNYYSFDPKNKVAEVTILGQFELNDSDSKIVTDYIKIEKELSWNEVLILCNSGYGNSGNGNSGNRNSGDGNSGDGNSGDGNSGNGNSGYGNSGNRNSGDGNSGDGNSGYGNSGDGNSGNRNSGDGNSGNRNSGYGNSGYGNSGNRNSGNRNSGDGNSGDFNTDEPFLRLFNKESTWKREDYYNHPSFCIINKFDLILLDEKNIHKDLEIIGGYTKVNDYKASWKIWRAKITNEEIEIIKTIPNFDSAIFEEITGLKI